MQHLFSYKQEIYIKTYSIYCDHFYMHARWLHIYLFILHNFTKHIYLLQLVAQHNISYVRNNLDEKSLSFLTMRLSENVVTRTRTPKCIFYPISLQIIPKSFLATQVFL